MSKTETKKQVTLNNTAFSILLVDGRPKVAEVKFDLNGNSDVVLHETDGAVHAKEIFKIKVIESGLFS